MSSLNDSITNLSGVGPKRAAALADLGIRTINDLLLYFPFRYEDLSVKNLSEVVDQQKITLRGIVASEPTIARFGRKKVRVNFRLLVDQESVMVIFFNQPWIKNQIEADSELTVYGKWDANRRSLTGMKIVNVTNDIEAVYPANKHVRQSTIKQLVEDAYQKYQAAIVDIIPTDLIQKYRLDSRQQMIYDLHFPKGQERTTAARRTAMFEEFLTFQMGLQIMKERDHQENGISINYDSALVTKLVSDLPFKLTDAQIRVIKEILSDIKSDTHMNRLLQGDVGSGKTVVAAVAMYAVVTNQKQAVLMAPTEILAEQHANNLANFFKGYDVNIALLVGGMRKKARDSTLANIKNGSVDIIVGTHALIQDDVEFKDVGLVITDEQHRFGVHQRQLLREKGVNPDVLAMTATPIPRTLAITSYGEMDVSIIDQLPAGRKAIRTSWVKHGEWDKVLRFLAKQFVEGHHAFIVTPLIEESEAMDLQNAKELHEQLSEHFGEQFQIGLLHGQMSSDEKDQIMDEFKQGKYSAIVSTTVIEVGVDVPNATVMVIHDADRFGLAQLHQLRGRVGRGSAQAYCILVADPKNQTGRERMQIMVDTTDGFKISEADLKMRGQGDLFGKQQSGVPIFKVGDPVVDIGALQTAQIEASKIVTQDNWQQLPQYQNINNYLDQELQLNQTLD